MRKTTDTNPKYSNRDIPDGEREFEVIKVMDGPKGSDKWVLRYDIDVEGEQLLWPNNEGDLLRVLGCTEGEKGIFSWDTDMVEGKKFTATVIHEVDKKDKVTMRQSMKGFKKSEKEADVPF